MEIKVSVVMPSLNVRDYIEEAVRSAMGQTLREIEIICIDAGSKDGTYEILEKLAREDSRVKLLKSDVKSYGYQVNLGIENACGKYVAILETDDFISKDMYEELYNEAERNDCDYVKSDYFAYWTQENGERIFLNRKTFADKELYNKVIEPNKFREVANGDWYLWNGIYKKEFIINNDIKLSETAGAAFQDIGFIHKTTNKAKRAIYLPQMHYRYCIDRAESSSNSGKGLRYSHYEFSKIYEEIKEEKNENIIKNFYSRMGKSVFCCYQGICPEMLNSEDEERKSIYEWFKARFEEGIENKYIDEYSFPPVILNKLKVLFESEKAYANEIIKAEKELEDICNGGKIAIFGCGNKGYELYSWVKKHNYSVYSFLDNNAGLWGKEIDGIKVDAPKNAKGYPKDIKFFIANEIYFEEIREQLKTLEISEENIFIYK